MKLEKAIEILEQPRTPSFWGENPGLDKATKLGIEALNFKQAWRKGQYFPPGYLLPGETED